MEQVFPARRKAPENASQVVENGGVHDPRASRDVARGESWLFFEHRTLAEVFAAERQP